MMHTVSYDEHNNAHFTERFVFHMIHFTKRFRYEHNNAHFTERIIQNEHNNAHFTERFVL